MMRDFLDALIAANVAGGVAVLVILMLRLPARRWFGPRIAYGLWALAPLAALATLLPARTVTVVAPALPPAGIAVAANPGQVLSAPMSASSLDPWPIVAGLWLAGMLASIGWLAWRQIAFARAADAGLAGPAAVGVLNPRVIVPSNFARRYSERERQVVLAHEAAHIARHDPRINALVALARCVNWFNPAIHVLAHLQRVDQELACDAAVVAAHPQARRSYAEAMLKTQLAHRPPPLGCAWLSPGDHPLAERVRLLAEPGPGRGRRRLGGALVVALALGAVGGAWAAKPANFVAVEPSLNEPAPAAQNRPPARPKPVKAPPPKRLEADRPIIASTPPSPAAAAAAAEGEAAADAYDAPAGDQVSLQPARAERPARRIFAAAKRSQVEPGTAVRVVASYTDPDGRPLMTDLTSFGSQHFYRTGSYIRDGSRHVLFTSVVQRGDVFWVTAALNRNFQGPAIGTIGLRSGETRDLTLGDGQVVIVTATARPETPEEMAAADGAFRRVGAEIQRTSDTTWAMMKSEEARCRRDACRRVAFSR